MKTKQSVANSNNHQPSTACREKHTATKLPVRSTVVAAFGLLSTLLPVSQTAHAQGTAAADAGSPPLVFQAAGPTANSIQSTVDEFRAALGNPNNLNNAGPLNMGRREINWDGGSPAIVATTPPVNPFNVFSTTRGAQFTTPGMGLSQATPAGLASATLFNNPTYATTFSAFSLSRLFTPVGSNITEGLFFVPGTFVGATNTGAPAAVTGFGAVFSDVDQPDGSGPGNGKKHGNRGNRGASTLIGASTFIQYFDRDGKVIFSSSVPASPGDATFSFFGIVFDDARIARVRVTTGDTGPGPNDDSENDIVMMDDFIYGEPQPLH